MKKIAIVITHPIQYYAPFFQLLAKRGRIQTKVFYTWPQAIEGFEDPNFQKRISWDIPLLEGYHWEAVKNISSHPSSKTWPGIDCPDLVNKIKDFNPGAVLIYGWRFKAHFKVMRYFKGKIPVFFTGDSTLLCEGGALKRWTRRFVLWWVYRFVDKCFYVGHNSKRYFLAHGLKKDQLEFFPHAVENERFADPGDYADKAAYWRRELGFGKQDKVVLFTGKLDSFKDPMILIDAVKSVRSKQASVKLLIVGDGVLGNELKQRAIDIDWLKLLAFQNQSKMPLVYRLADIYCMPTRCPGETWGLSVNEAMACGLPILVSDKIGCALDLVHLAKNGYIFEAGNKDSLVSHLELMLSQDLKELGLASDEIIRDWNYKKKCEVLEKNVLNDA